MISRALGRVAWTWLAVLALVLGALLIPSQSASAASTAVMKGRVTTPQLPVVGTAVYVPLPGATVSILNASTRAVIKTGLSDSAGVFRMYGVPANVPVKVKFQKATYLTNFASRKSSFPTATTYVLTAGKTTWLPSQNMIKEAVIQGQVLGWMDPLGGATVKIWNASTHVLIKSVHLAEYQYEYRIGGLPPARIKVQATHPGWFDSWADGASSWSTARTFQLVSGQTLSQLWSPSLFLFLDLTPGEQIGGDVLGLGPNYDDPLGGVLVQAIDVNTHAVLAQATTWADPSAPAWGTYMLTGIVTQNPVKIRFSKPDWITSYASNKPSWTSADVYPIQPGGSIYLGTQDLYACGYSTAR